MKSHMVVEVSFLPGTDLVSAVTEAKNKANLWDVVYVKFKFNGVNLSIGKTADISKVVSEYESNPEDNIICNC